jgi:hypothetical protein
VTRWLGLDDRTQIAWDRDYAITDLTTELNHLTAMQLTDFSEATLTAKRQQIVSLAFAALDPAELDVLLTAEGEAAHERTPLETATDAETDAEALT